MIVALLQAANSKGAALVILALAVLWVVRKGIKVTIEPLHPPKPHKRDKEP